MIQTTGSDRKSFENLSFESNIAYVDFESGYYRVKADGFADLDRFTI
jgi:hypothetical protein